MARNHDVLIVGGSHAGLAAAQTLYRHGHRCIIFDADDSREDQAWIGSDNSRSALRLVAGLDGGDSRKLRAATKFNLQDVASAFITISPRRIIEVSKIEDATHSSFVAKDDLGGVHRARTVLLAFGCDDHLPDIPGYDSCYPQRIFHCLFTYGAELRGSDRCGLLACDALSNPHHAAMLVTDALKISRNVTVFTHGSSTLRHLIQAELSKLDSKLNDLVGYIEGRVGALRASSQSTNGPTEGARAFDSQIEVQVLTDSGQASTFTLDFLVHQPRTTASNAPLLSSLGICLDDRGNIPTEGPFQRTMIPGVYAAGDCASLFKIIPAAMFTGAAAGAGLSRDLGPAIVRGRTFPADLKTSSSVAENF